MELVVARFSRDLVLHVRGTQRSVRGKRRGICRRFSSSSCRRMLFHLRNCNVPFRVMVTLTYPMTYPRDWRRCQTHLRRFLDRLCRRFPGVKYFWFLEFQRRGAPHFHVFLDRWVDKKWVSVTWASVCAPDVPEPERELHLAAGTRCEWLRGGLGAAVKYAAKYAAKWEQKEPPAGFAGSGRWWSYGGYRLVAKVVFTVVLLYRRLVWTHDRLTGPWAWLLGLGDRVAAALSGFVLRGTMGVAEWDVLRAGGWLRRSRWFVRGGSGEFWAVVRELVAALCVEGVGVWCRFERRVGASAC